MEHAAATNVRLNITGPSARIAIGVPVYASFRYAGLTMHVTPEVLVLRDSLYVVSCRRRLYVVEESSGCVVRCVERDAHGPLAQAHAIARHPSSVIAIPPSRFARLWKLMVDRKLPAARRIVRLTRFSGVIA